MVLDMLAEKDMERGRRQMGGGGHNEYGSQMGGGGGDRRPGGFGFGPPVEVAVPPNYIGLVIGKGGESIKRIQQESGTKIQFDTSKTDNNGNKICSISGPPDCIARAQDMIQDIIDNAAANRSGKFMGGEEVRMPVPSNRCGAVIGRGGETIRVIKQQSGCDIELDKISKTMGGDEKIFIIRGPPDRIPMAKQLINEKVRGGNASPPPEHNSSGFGSQSGDYSWSNYYQAEHGIPPAVAAAAASGEF
jgi:far upstream element-binding protein